MRILFVRHTRVAVPEGTIYGQSDVALADTYEEEMDRVHQRLPESCSVLFSSPLSRCRQLAESIGGKYGKRPVWDNRLKEMDFGHWEGKRWQEIPQDQAKYWGNHWMTEPVPGGESFQDLIRRASLFRKEHLLSPGWKEHDVVIIVSHSGPLRCLCLQIHPEYQTWEQQKAFKIPLNYGDVIDFSFAQ